MKKNLFLLAALIVFAAGISEKAVAQTQTVTTGIAYSYSVTLTNGSSTVAWVVYASDGTTLANPAHYTISSATATNPTITWAAAAATNTYVVKATETLNGCSDATPSQVTVSVLSIPAITITTADDASCSATASVDLTVNTTNSAALRYPLTVNYTANGVAQTPVTITSASPTVFTIPASVLTNSTTADITTTIAITGVTDAKSVSLDITGDVSWSRLVYYTPNTSGITAE